jgi:hypothetical protein
LQRHLPATVPGFSPGRSFCRGRLYAPHDLFSALRPLFSPAATTIYRAALLGGVLFLAFFGVIAFA